MRTDEPSPELGRRIQATLETAPLRPWCVHRLYESIVAAADGRPLDAGLSATEQAAEALRHGGRVQGESVSALAIGVHCQDSLYWSVRSQHHRLEEFGPEYAAPTILYRLAAHFRCHGL